MIKEAAPILRRQKQDYEASFEVIAKLTSELNEARKVTLFFALLIDYILHTLFTIGTIGITAPVWRKY